MHELESDDGQRSVDEQGETQIPLDPEKEYDEVSSCYMSAWAATYREGRDQKNVGTRVRGTGKTKKRFLVKNKFSSQEVFYENLIRTSSHFLRIM